MIAFAHAPPTDDPDAILMLQLCDGDREAFEQLYNRHYQRVVGLATRLIGDESVAEDLAQQVFLQVFRARSSYLPTAQFTTWLFTITRNVVFNARRSLARRQETSVGAFGTGQFVSVLYTKPSAEPGPFDAAVQTETKRKVWHAIDQLGCQQQQAIWLVCIGGLSHRSAAEQMDVSEASIKQLVFRGRRRLRSLLGSSLELTSVS